MSQEHFSRNEQKTLKRNQKVLIFIDFSDFAGLGVNLKNRNLYKEGFFFLCGVTMLITAKL